MKMIELAKRNRLNVIKKVDFGHYISDSQGLEILLPNKYCPEDIELNQKIEVFIYKDSEDRLIATTETPKACVGEIANMKVVSVNDYGAFVDWGLSKDLFVPFREQKRPLSEGQYHPIYVYVDVNSNRIVGSANIDKLLNPDGKDLERNIEVSIVVYDQTEIGYKIMINNTHKGLIHNEDVYQYLEIGFESKAYIKKIRDDFKIDVALSKQGYTKVYDELDKIIDALENNNGFLKLNDKSHPDDIKRQFNISKATFKKAIGSLYKNKKILIKDDGIYLIKKF